MSLQKLKFLIGMMMPISPPNSKAFSPITYIIANEPAEVEIFNRHDDAQLTSKVSLHYVPFVITIIIVLRILL